MAAVSHRSVALLALALVLAGVSVVAEDPDYHAILGLGPEAQQLDATLAYTNLTRRYSDARLGSPERHRLVEVQQAFEALADDQMKQEALEVVEYSDHVRLLRDDAELAFFTQLHPGGTAHVRVVFVMDSHDKLWQAFATATQLDGNAKVAQLCHRDASDAKGTPMPFLASLKVRQYPSAVIFDPISRAFSVSSNIDSVRGEVQKFLDGRLDPTEKLARVQELDVESYRIRCSAPWKSRSEECKWVFILATTAASEANMPSLFTTLSNFAEACRTFHQENFDDYSSIGCFWLRLDRAAEWAQTLRSLGMVESMEAVVAAASWRSGALTLGRRTVEAGIGGMARWFQETFYQEPQAGAGPLPPLPWPVSVDEEPTEGLLVQATRLTHELLEKLAKKAGPRVQIAIRDFQRMDNEGKILAAGAGLCGVLLVLYIFRRRGTMTEEQVMKTLVPVLPIQLSRQEGERLGMSIAAGDRNCLMVTGINKGDVIDRHNTSETHDARRILGNDRIIFAEAAGSRATKFGEISALLKANKSVTLGLATPRASAVLQCSIFMTKLGDVSLTEAEVRAPSLSWGGAADAKGVEIAVISPALAAWNAKRRQEGLCCTQVLQVGDRIISCDGQTDVRAQLAKNPSPVLLVARWWPTGTCVADRFEVSIERTSADDKLGMHLRVIIGQAHYQIVEVFSYGLVARRNADGIGRQILAGDRIVAANGAADPKAMEAEMVKPRLALTIERWMENGAAGDTWQPVAAAAVVPAAANASAPAPAEKPASAKVEASPRSEWRCFSLNFLVGPLGLLVCLVLSYDDITKIGVQRYLKGELLDQERYRKLAAIAMGTGAALLSYFLWYEISMLSRPLDRGTWSQVALAAAASTCLGYGNWFLQTWAFA